MKNIKNTLFMLALASTLKEVRADGSGEGVLYGVIACIVIVATLLSLNACFGKEPDNNLSYHPGGIHEGLAFAIAESHMNDPLLIEDEHNGSRPV